MRRPRSSASSRYGWMSRKGSMTAASFDWREATRYEEQPHCSWRSCLKYIVPPSSAGFDPILHHRRRLSVTTGTASAKAPGQAAKPLVQTLDNRGGAQAAAAAHQLHPVAAAPALQLVQERR